MVAGIDNVRRNVWRIGRLIFAPGVLNLKSIWAVNTYSKKSVKP